MQPVNVPWIAGPSLSFTGPWARVTEMYAEQLLWIRRNERRRIARELHDTTAHALGVAEQSLELHRLLAESDPERAQQRLELAEQSVREALKSVLDIGTELRLASQDKELGEALDDYLARTAPTDVKTELTTSGPLHELPRSIADEVYLIVREAAHNAFLHAEPRHLTIDVGIADGVLTARVDDDGTGFDPEVTAHHGGGLLSMSERAELIGARLRVRSRAAGTAVELRLPVAAGTGGAMT
ncbi:sensor histidine kinase [Streptomyces cellulosae]|uniref:Sensor histidine kinase n=1 Tax=Streptomyces cellulosae TaxID=1968 RepID=A0ABW7YC90_STRCE